MSARASSRAPCSTVYPGAAIRSSWDQLATKQPGSLAPLASCRFSALDGADHPDPLRFHTPRALRAIVRFTSKPNMRRTPQIQVTLKTHVSGPHRHAAFRAFARVETGARRLISAIACFRFHASLLSQLATALAPAKVHLAFHSSVVRLRFGDPAFQRFGALRNPPMRGTKSIIRWVWRCWMEKF